jgi:hypothetical protein
MELVAGTNLGRFCQAHTAKGQRVPIPIALYITTQVLRGLAYAHANASTDGKRLVHRDISPGNILLSTFGEVKVADFGVALVGGSADTRAGDGWIVGKPAYMAPEQLERSAVDERADIYAVGAVLFQTVTGSLHRGDIAPGSVEIPTGISPQARAALAAAAPPELVEIVLRALAPHREGRYAHARQMARAIEQLVETGQKIASADELAEVVSAMVQGHPAQTKSVLVLSAGDDAASGLRTELTRIGDGEDKHGFTLKIRDTPPASAPSATTAAVDVDEEELLLRPRRGRWVGVGLVGLVLLGAAVVVLSRGPSDASGRRPLMETCSRLAAAADPAAAGDGGIASAPSAAGSATTASAAAGRTCLQRDTRREAHREERRLWRLGCGAQRGVATASQGTYSRAKRPRGSGPREPLAAAGPSSACRGQLHLYATHGWLPGGPRIGPGTGAIRLALRHVWTQGRFEGRSERRAV